MRDILKYDYIDETGQLVDFCERIRDCRLICFDTEFVSEDTYRPDLCIIQVAAGDELAVIDAKCEVDLKPFWELLADGDHETVFHAGREEFLFCYREIGRPPVNMFDTQVAAGFIGLEFPTSYAKLIHRILGKSLPKGETRTNWRQRPLSDRQIEYALHDVTFLTGLRDSLHDRLKKSNRTDWFQQEMAQRYESLEDTDSRQGWLRLSGFNNLNAKARILARELWRWREEEAARLDRPPRRTLRDDLLVELAKRGFSDIQRIRSIRGMEQGHMRSRLPGIATCIENAKTEAKPEPAPKRSNELPSQVQLIAQFLSIALGCVCREHLLAPTIVGTVQDVRDLVAYRMGAVKMLEEPDLMKGWRAEIIGQTLDKLLKGETAIRIVDPNSDQPLSFEDSS